MALRPLPMFAPAIDVRLRVSIAVATMGAIAACGGGGHGPRMQETARDSVRHVDERGEDDASGTDALVEATSDVSEAGLPSHPSLSTIAQLSLGGAHSCARLVDGTVRCWGKNDLGQLGDGTNQNSALARTVSGLSSIAEVQLGARHACARRTDGTVWCWGWNQEGQLGDGTTTDGWTPTAVIGLKDVVQLAAGSAETCARLADRTLRCWGANHVGQLGDGTTTNRSTPVAVVGLVNAVEVATRGFHTCARLASGVVSCWGNNRDGELGDGVFTMSAGGGSFPTVVRIGTDRSRPGVIPNFAGAVGLALGGTQSCARRSDSSLWCWGRGDFGQLGPFARTFTPAVAATWAGSMQFGLGANHACALGKDLVVRCAGQNTSGQLGSTPTSPSISTPVTVPVTVGASDVVDLAVGAFHSCVRLGDGTARCWGANHDGQLGDGTTATRSSPVTVVQ